jgi:uncharacterized protein (TIRG00374 family)
VAERSGEEKPVSDLRRALFWGGLSVAISVTTIVLIFRLTENHAPLADLLRVGLGTLLVAAVMVITSWVVDGWRLWVLAKAMGGSVSFVEAVRISLTGAFMAGITPFDTGGEPLKVYYLHRSGMSVGQATATITLAAMLHATTRFLLWLVVPLVAFFLGFSWQFTTVVKVTLTLGLIVYLFFMFLLLASTLWPNTVVSFAVWLFNRRVVKRFVSPDLLGKIEGRVRGVAEDFREGMMKFASKGTQAVYALLLSIVYWLVVISVPMFLLREMGSTASAFQIFSLSMTVYLVMAYMPTPGASGGAEVGSAIFFSPFLPARVLGTFVIVWRVLTYYLTLVAGGALVVLDTLAHSYRKIKLQAP